MAFDFLKICSNGKGQGCFGGKEAIEIETLKAKILLEFFDPVFRISPLFIQRPDHLHRQVQIGDKTTVAIVFLNRFLIEQFQLLHGRFQAVRNVLTHHN